MNTADYRILRPPLISKEPLSVSGLTTGYEKGPDIIHEVSFDLEPGRFACILGENGCGKTTLLKAILALLPARHGSVTIGKTNLLTLNEAQRARRLAYIPQAHRTPFPFTVGDVIRMGRTAYLRRFSRETEEDRAIADACMRQMQIEHLADWPYTKLSGGQQQLVLIARALAQQAAFLIMDEPTSHLDYGNQYRVLEKVNELRQYGIGVLMVTHDPAHCFFASDRVMLMVDGKIVATAAPEEVITSQSMSELYRFPIAVKRFQLECRAHRYACVPGALDSNIYRQGQHEDVNNVSSASDSRLTGVTSMPETATCSVALGVSTGNRIMRANTGDDTHALGLSIENRITRASTGSASGLESKMLRNTTASQTRHQKEVLAASREEI
jgi:iron complex transport system ATP-binding protein